MDNEKGVWRTIRGNHIFIKEGQTVEEAFKEHLEKVKGAKKDPNKLTLKEKQKYGPITIERRQTSSKHLEDVNVGRQVKTIKKQLDKKLGAGNYEMFAHGSGSVFQQLSDLFGYSGEGAQVHGNGVYALLEKWEKSKDYAKKAFSAAVQRLEISGISRDFLGYTREDLEGFADELEDIILNHTKTGFKDIPEENRWSVANNLSARMGEFGIAKTRAMQNFLAQMYKEDFKNYNEFKQGLERTINDIIKGNERAKEALKKVKPQVLIGVVPPETKKHLFVVNDNRENSTLIKEQNPEIQEAVKRIVDAVPPYHYEYYEIDGKKYLYTPNSMFSAVSVWDENAKQFVLVYPSDGSKEIEAQIKKMGKPTGVLEKRTEKISDDMSYADLLRLINRNWGGDESTISKKLAEYGIYGLRYHGRVDGDCIVQFDPSKFDSLVRNVDGEWRDASGRLSAPEKADLRKTQPYKRFEDKVTALKNDVRHYGIKGLELQENDPEIRINDKGGLSSYIKAKYTTESGKVYNFEIRVSNHAKHVPNKKVQIYVNDDPQVNGRSFEQKLKDKIAQIESLKGKELPVETNTTSDSIDG